LAHEEIDLNGACGLLPKIPFSGRHKNLSERFGPITPKNMGHPNLGFGKAPVSCDIDTLSFH
jgi:hypothetical protein